MENIPQSKRQFYINGKWHKVGESFRKGLFLWEIVFIDTDSVCTARNSWKGVRNFHGSVYLTDRKDLN
jgi:hypothetical protein